MRFYWMDHGNYGDMLTPYICARFGIPCRPARKKKPEALMVGSIASLAKRGTHVFGSGFIDRRQTPCKDAQWHWVRGPVSRQMVLAAGGEVPERYGDAALLLPEWIAPERKAHDVGYIPHFIDRKHVSGGFVIDLCHPDIEAITRDITRCRSIISSSLHGTIVAHAYGIPAAWVRWSDGLAGDGMKFHDHYASVGLEPVLSSAEAPVFQAPEHPDTSHMKETLAAFAQQERRRFRFFFPSRQRL